MSFFRLPKLRAQGDWAQYYKLPGSYIAKVEATIRAREDQIAFPTGPIHSFSLLTRQCVNGGSFRVINIATPQE